MYALYSLELSASTMSIGSIVQITQIGSLQKSFADGENPILRVLRYLCLIPQRGAMAGGIFFGPEGRRILDLLVYRCSEDQFFAEQRSDVDRSVRELGLDPASREPSMSRLKGYLSDKHGGSWLVNEAVGLITIFVAPSKIGALSYFVRGRIVKHMAKRRMFLEGKLFEFNIWLESGRSEQIYGALRQKLGASTQNVGRFRGRVIDFEPLDNLGPHIDWAAITSPQSALTDAKV